MTMQNGSDATKMVFDLSTYNDIKQLATDLVNGNITEFGKTILSQKLLECVEQHGICLDNMMKAIDALHAKCKSLEDMINAPCNREKEFIDVAKKLNFPPIVDVPTIQATNPNIAIDEDKLPKNVVKFVKDRLDGSNAENVKIPKEEQLSKKEIERYTHIDKAFEIDQTNALKPVKKEKKNSSRRSKSINGKTACLEK